MCSEKSRIDPFGCFYKIIIWLPYELYLFSGALVSETTMFWSMKMRSARRKPSPMALTTFMADRRSNGATLKMGRLWTLNTGTDERQKKKTLSF